MKTTNEMEALKAKLKSTWESGDYDHFSEFLKPGAIEFLERLDIPPGSKVLDIGCGSGQITIPMVKRGIDVAGVDLAQTLVDQGNSKAQAMGLGNLIQQGDAENLQFPDQSFDIAISLIGSMFAPRPELVASEMLRVVKPGGKIVMGNWTPGGHVGQFFKVVGKFVPPPQMIPSPLLWGDPSTVKQRFGDRVSDLRITKHLYPFILQLSPSEVTEFFVDYYGPTNRAFASLDGEAQRAFKEEFTAVWEDNNLATDGTTDVGAEYIEVVGTKA